MICRNCQNEKLSGGGGGGGVEARDGRGRTEGRREGGLDGRNARHKSDAEKVERTVVHGA